MIGMKLDLLLQLTVCVAGTRDNDDGCSCATIA
jgi:hypothetical protein